MLRRFESKELVSWWVGRYFDLITVFWHSVQWSSSRGSWVFVLLQPSFQVGLHSLHSAGSDVPVPSSSVLDGSSCEATRLIDGSLRRGTWACILVQGYGCELRRQRNRACWQGCAKHWACEGSKSICLLSVLEMGNPPHPLAGQRGEGPPVCPPNWKWRCGNRLRDMYFYSPEGKTFRSRLELANHLKSLPDAPSPDDFCWMVTDEIVKTGVWTKEESPAKSSKSPAKRKPTNLETEKPAKKAEPEEIPAKEEEQKDPGSNGTPQIPTPSPALNGVQFSSVEPLAIRHPSSVKLKKMPPASPVSSGLTSRAKVKARKDKNEVSHTFKEVLAEPSSFKWLYDSEALEKFLDEAGRLSDRSPAEITELRSLLVERNLQIGNITKYPNSVLRVFLRLLGLGGLSEEPSTSLGKVELADLCLKLARA